MILVTGGAGFIGSNVVAALNERGVADVVVNDTLGSDQKWRNLAKRQIADFVFPQDLNSWLSGRKLEAVVHLGAISATTATDADAIIESNFRLSLATGLVYGGSRSVCLRVLRGHVRGSRIRFYRRLVIGSFEAIAADEPLRLE